MLPSASERVRTHLGRSEQIQIPLRTYENFEKLAKTSRKLREARARAVVSVHRASLPWSWMSRCRAWRWDCVCLCVTITDHSFLIGLIREVFQRFREVFQRFREVFPSFSKLSDTFGPVRTHSDLFGCIRTHLDAFGNVWVLSEKIANFDDVGPFLDVLEGSQF